MKRRMAVKKPSTDSSDDVVVIASSSSICELADKPKPDIRYCKNKESEFENRILQWLENESETTDQAEPQKLDEVNHAMASMALQICRDPTVRERSTLLFELQKYMHDFINLCLDREQYQQNAMVPQQQQNQPLMFAQDQNQLQQQETFMGMLHQMQQGPYFF